MINSQRNILRLSANLLWLLAALLAKPFDPVAAQSGQCAAIISPASQNFSALGGQGTVTLTLPTQCAWTARSNAPWVKLDSAASGTGSTTLRYTVEPTIHARQGTVIVGGATFVVQQEFNACASFGLTGTAQTAPLPLTPLPPDAPTGGLRSFNTALALLRDFNQDGRPDLVAAGSVNDHVVLHIFPGLAGNIWGVPATPLIINARTVFNARISGVAAADFTRDGQLDLAVLSESQTAAGELRAQLWLIAGRGANGFAAPQATAINTQFQVAGLVAGDFNNDNLPDVIVTGAGTPRGWVYLNNGAGGWRAPLALSTALDAYSAQSNLFVTDWDGDGKLDVLWGNVAVLKGDGMGNFTLWQVLPTANRIGAYTFGDLNGDGKMDLLYTDLDNNQRSRLQIALNDGSGRLLNGPTIPLTVPNLLQEATLLATDFNQDGRADITLRYVGGWQVLFSVPNDRLFAEPQLYLSGYAQLQTPLAADLNNDGRRDLLFLYGEVTETMFGNSTGVSGVRGFYYTDEPPRNYVFAVGDVNADGWVDAVTPGGTLNQLRVWQGNGRGAFTLTRTLTTTLDPLGPMQALTLRDFNRDGSPDLAVLYRNARTVEIWLNDGRGAFSSRLKLTVGTNATQLDFADFNEDGALDLVTTGANGGLAVWLGNGRGDFASGATGLGGAQAGGAFAIADFHGDGKLDLLLLEPGTTSAPRFVILPGTGQGGFGAAEFINAPQASPDFVAGDLNADGRADLLYRATTEIGSYNVVLSQGATGWAAPTNYSEFGFLGGGIPPRLGDVNGDGKLDFYLRDLSVVRLGRGDGSFQPALAIATGTELYEAALTDVDADGYEDFLGLSLHLPALGVIRNRASCLPPGGAVVTSAASYAAHRTAPNGIFSIFGTNLAATTQSATTLPLPTTLGVTSVRLRDSAGVERLAPLFFVSPAQINFLLPVGMAAGGATFTVLNGNSATATGTLLVAAVAPGLFSANASGQGLPAALVLRVRANGTQVYEPLWRVEQNRLVAVPLSVSNAAEQVFLILYGTGLRNRATLESVTARVGGVAVEVAYAGSQGGLAGLDQLNLRLPPALAGRGEVTVEIVIEGRALNPVQFVLQ